LGLKWRHYCATLVPGGAITLYLDGQEVATAPAGAISYAGLGQNSRIATHGNGNASYDLAGIVDDVRIYDRALKFEEAYRLYRGGRVNGVRITKWVETR
jgi:hypothetical protein